MHLQVLLCLSSSAQKFSHRGTIFKVFPTKQEAKRKRSLLLLPGLPKGVPLPYHPLSLFCSHPFTLAYQWSLVLVTAMIRAGQEETRCYSIIPKALQKSLFCSQSLWGKSTPVLPSSRRHTPCCFTHLLHCTTLCIPADLFGFSDPTKFTVTRFKSQPTILTVPPFTLKMEFPLPIFLLPD